MEMLAKQSWAPKAKGMRYILYILIVQRVFTMSAHLARRFVLQDCLHLYDLALEPVNRLIFEQSSA